MTIIISKARRCVQPNKEKSEQKKTFYKGNKIVLRTYAIQISDIRFTPRIKSYFMVASTKIKRKKTFLFFWMKFFSSITKKLFSGKD